MTYSPRASWLLLAALLLSLTAHAEKADRQKPLTIEADQPGSMDLQSQTVVFNGNVVITQGTLTIRAAHVEVKDRADGGRLALASGQGSRQATFRQKREGLNESIEGVADRIEYDGQADTVRFTGNAAVRRLRGTVVADEVTGAVVTYDNVQEIFAVQGGPTAVSPSNPTGRVRAVIAPREMPASGAASSPASAPALRPSTQLGERR